jgi:uncharacterized cupredoxin-like copper-binding protein
VSALLRRIVRIASLLTLALLTQAFSSACQAGSGGGGGSGQHLTIKGLDTMKFDPPALNVAAGQPIQLTLSNQGALIHDWVLSEGVDKPAKAEASGHANADVTFTIAKPGTYTFVCSQPGHDAAGMHGTIVAK